MFKLSVSATALLLLTVHAWANPAPTTWTTFLHAGPADRAAVIDEIDAGTVVDVQSCAAGWCRVVANHAAGYLPQALLALAPSPAAAAPGEQTCFSSPTFTRHGDGVELYCPKR